MELIFLAILFFCGFPLVSALPRVFGSSKQSNAELARYEVSPPHLCEVSGARTLIDFFTSRSPSHLLYAASSLLSSSPSMLSIRFLLMHGGKDRLTPYSQTVLLKNLLIGIGIKSERVRLRLYREETGLGGLSSESSSFILSQLVGREGGTKAYEFIDIKKTFFRFDASN